MQARGATCGVARTSRLQQHSNRATPSKRNSSHAIRLCAARRHIVLATTQRLAMTCIRCLAPMPSTTWATHWPSKATIKRRWMRTTGRSRPIRTMPTRAPTARRWRTGCGVSRKIRRTTTAPRTTRAKPVRPVDHAAGQCAGSVGPAGRQGQAGSRAGQTLAGCARRLARQRRQPAERAGPQLAHGPSIR